MLHSISLGVLAAAFLAASLAAPALALCGDGTIDTGEQCDDGAALSGDGCSDTCQVEWLHGFEVFGVAEGGSVELSLGGETIVAATLTGDFPEDVAAALASEVNASASLQAQGIGAVAESGVVQTSVAAGGTILDGGLSDVASDLDVVRFHRKLSDGQGGVSVLAGDRFGEALAGLGDLDGDGVADLAVGAPLGDLGGLDRGGVRVLFLDTGGRATSEQPFGRNTGGFTGVLGKEMFGGALANLGDLDGDGVVDLAVGAERDDDVATDTGSVWIVFLNTDGTVKAQQKISALEGGFAGPLATKDFFGA
jgi:cysteine-rich repeat protein